MTATTDRLLDYWLPPEGAGKPLGCVATTFTFEADFFEQQCLGRYLALDTRPGEAATDIGYLIEREEKLAETPVCVVADRSLSPDSRSLRWDVLPVPAPTGVMHAKVSLLVWDSVVRVIVTSANLSEQAFRRSIELAIAFDAFRGSEIPLGLFDDLIAALRRVVRRAPGGRRPDEPRARALDVLDRATVQARSFGMPDRARRGAPRVAVVMPGVEGDAVDGLMGVWKGGPPKWATVMSPYFEVAEGPSRAARRLVDVLAKRDASVDVVVPVEYLGDREVARVPRALLDAFPKRLDPTLFDVGQPDASEPRRLHGKLLLLESDNWIAALVGSSNFSAAGLGLDGGGNLEIGVAIGSARGSETGNALLALALTGDEVNLDGMDFEPVDDPEQQAAEIPAGFVQVLGEPGPPTALEIELSVSALPAEWWLRTPDGAPLLDAVQWRATGAESTPRILLAGEDLPFNVAVQWRKADGQLSIPTNIPVNVTDPGRLPAPAELRTLPAHALLRALASVRPLHEAVVEAIERHERARSLPADELDPLKRFSPSGQLLYRTRELSAALAGLQERLERPVATLDAFRWRLEGAFGPLAIADKLIAERSEGRGIEGEESFMLAEIALTLAGVELSRTSRFVPEQLASMRSAMRENVEALRSRAAGLPHAPGLDGYVRDAFRRAAR